MTEAGTGMLMQTGAFGLGSTAPDIIDSNANNVTGYNGFVSGAGANSSGYANAYGPMLVMRRISAVAQLQVLNKGIIAARYGSTDGFPDAWAIHYSTANTTRASDGTLKAASPVVQIFHDGSARLNAESEGCTVTRLAPGEYMIEGCIGMNADAAWGGIDGGFDVPKDRNGQPLI